MKNNRFLLKAHNVKVMHESTLSGSGLPSLVRMVCAREKQRTANQEGGHRSIATRHKGRTPYENPYRVLKRQR